MRRGYSWCVPYFSQMVQSGERVFFVSTNGRYAFLGPAIDLWHGEHLTFLADAGRLMGRIDRARLKLDPADLGALDLGEGTEEVWVFLDPQCPQCAVLQGKVIAVTLILVGLLGGVIRLTIMGLDQIRPLFVRATA